MHLEVRIVRCNIYYILIVCVQNSDSNLLIIGIHRIHKFSTVLNDALDRF